MITKFGSVFLIEIFIYELITGHYSHLQNDGLWYLLPRLVNPLIPKTAEEIIPQVREKISSGMYSVQHWHKNSRDFLNFSSIYFLYLFFLSSKIFSTVCFISDIWVLIDLNFHIGTCTPHHMYIYMYIFLRSINVPYNIIRILIAMKA